MKEGSIPLLPIARSHFRSAPLSVSHNPKRKTCPQAERPLILHWAPPQEVWTQPETLVLPPGLCDPLHVPAVDTSSLTSSQMLGQFPNTERPHADAQVCVKDTHTHTASTHSCKHAYTERMCVTAAYQRLYASPRTLTCTLPLSKTHFLPYLFFVMHQVPAEVTRM